MHRLNFDRESGSALRILCLGAHSDDIEIGCGGAILTLLETHPGSSVRWIVFSGVGQRVCEARASAAEFLASACERDVRTLEFRESFFPYEGAAIKSAFESQKDFAPDLIFSHRLEDRHQDHRLISELTWNTFRDHVILEYEVPKYEGDLRSPQAFIPLEAAVAREKCRLLCKHFASQQTRPWFDEELFLGLMRMRGVECRSSSGYAEGFGARKLVLG